MKRTPHTRTVWQSIEHRAAKLFFQWVVFPVLFHIALTIALRLL